MRTLIAVKSCWRDQKRGDHQVIRNTWGKDAWHVPFDVRFFMGNRIPDNLPTWWLEDEIALKCPDDYDSLPAKTRSITKWAVEQDYDFVWLVDNDTYIIPRLLADCDYELYDFSGRFGSMPAFGQRFNYKDDRGFYPNIYGWMSGGVGYCLSNKAAKIVSDTEPMIWAEDAFCGNALGKYIESGDIKACDLPDFENIIAFHFPRRKFQTAYDPKYGWQEEMYRQYGEVQ